MIGKKVIILAGCTAGIIEHVSMLPVDNLKTHSQYRIYQNYSYLQLMKLIYN